MKMIPILLALTATAIVALSSNAVEPLHSPRAHANQIRTGSGVAPDSLNRSGLHQQRGHFAAPPRTKGISSGPDLLRESRNSLVTGRAIDVFPWLLKRSGASADTLVSARAE